MNHELLWKDIKDMLRGQGQSNYPGEYLVTTKHEGIKNSVKIVDEGKENEHFRCLSEGANKWRQIFKADVLLFAEEAKREGHRGFDIRETKDRIGSDYNGSKDILYIGSLVCSMLENACGGEFKYEYPKLFCNAQ